MSRRPSKAHEQETGAVLRDDEIGQAFQFGNEATVQNVLEKNWWESDAFQEEQRQVAEEILRLDGERRRKIEEGEEVEEDVKEFKVPKDERVIARTRVSSVKEAKLTYSCNLNLKKLQSSSRWAWHPVSPPSVRLSGLSEVEIKIIGFQSPDNLAIEDNMKHSYFLYPDEDVGLHSTFPRPELTYRRILAAREPLLHYSNPA